MSVISKINQNVIQHVVKPLNDYFIVDYRRKQINNILEFISVVYEESVKLFEGHVKYLGYELLSPEDRALYELNSKYDQININNFEWNLVKFNFEYVSEKESFTFYSVLYIPYQINDFIVIDNTTYGLNFLLTDKIFAKNNRDIVIKLLKSPLHFRTELFTLFPENSDRPFHVEIPCTKIHNKTSNTNYIPIFMYFICKYGLQEALDLFNISQDILKIEENVYFKGKRKNVDIDNYYYFRIAKSTKTKFIKVKKDQLENNIIVMNITASLLRILSKFKVINIPLDELYLDYGHWYIFLGKLIYGNRVERARLFSNIQKHFASLDTYLDPISQRRFQSFGLIVNSIYDILKFMFENINEINIKYFKNDMRLKRADVTEQLLIDIVVNKLYRKIYKYKNRNNKYRSDKIPRLFDIGMATIKEMYKFDSVSSSINCYNDCKLFNYFSKIIKPSNSSKSEDSHRLIQKLKFNPTYLLVYSLLGFSTNKPHITGTINPYVEINEYGGYEVKDNFQKYIDESIFKYFK